MFFAFNFAKAKNQANPVNETVTVNGIVTVYEYLYLIYYSLKNSNSIKVIIHFVQKINFCCFRKLRFMKKVIEKKSKQPVEIYWQKLINTYFEFYKENFRDEDGFRLTPDWSGTKSGMEAKGLKGIVVFLRGIAEGKKIEWTEEYAVSRLIWFLKKAYNIQFLKNNFYCALLNKKKVDVIISTYNPELVKSILEIWYFEFPEYARVLEKDKAAAEIIINYLKEQYILASAEYSDSSLLSSVRLIFKTVKEDEFWNKKPLKSIANNLQEFINKIKANQNGRNINSGGVKKTPIITIKPEGGFGNL